jgi:hypothetical protein
MASDVDICNSALNMIGASNIISLTEDSKAGRVCNQRYEFVRDSVFRAHPWNCLIRRAALSALSDAPSYEYTKQYQLPTDPFCLRVLDVEGEVSSGVTYVIEGRKLLTDEGTINLRYLARVTDANEYDALLTETISARMAHEIAYTMTNSNGFTESLWNLYLMKLSEARFADATEGTPEELVSDNFTTIRL